MILKNCFLVLLKKVASALEGLRARSYDELTLLHQLPYLSIYTPALISKFPNNGFSSALHKATACTHLLFTSYLARPI